MSEYGNYSGDVLEFLKSKNIHIGNYVEITGKMNYKVVRTPVEGERFLH